MDQRIDFDDAVTKLHAPYDENFCKGIYFDTDFSRLEPRWAVAKLEKKEIEESTLILIFRGVNETEMWFVHGQGLFDRNRSISEEYARYEEGADYRIDMNNFCKYHLSMLSSSTVVIGRISSTITEPEKISCDI